MQHILNMHYTSVLPRYVPILNFYGSFFYMCLHMPMYVVKDSLKSFSSHIIT